MSQFSHSALKKSCEFVCQFAAWTQCHDV